MEKKKKEGSAPAEKPGGVHAGHRSRMRRRFLAGGLEGFQEHEVLELLLFYAIPRKDVNELAHLLIRRFGNLAGVLDAPEEELCQVPGVGPHVAHFLNLIPEVMVQMARQSFSEEPVTLRAPKDIQGFLAQRGPDFPLGQVLLILTDGLHHLLAVHVYAGFEDLAIRQVASQAATARASRAVLVERVADSADFPAPEKLQALDALARKMSILEVPLWDYLTVDSLDRLPHSYARSGQLLPR